MAQALDGMQRLRTSGASVWPWRLPPSLWAALVPWWLSFGLAASLVLEGRALAGAAWLAGGLAYSAVAGAVALLRLAGDPA